MQHCAVVCTVYRYGINHTQAGWVYCIDKGSAIGKHNQFLNEVDQWVVLAKGSVAISLCSVLRVHGLVV